EGQLATNATWCRLGLVASGLEQPAPVTATFTVVNLSTDDDGKLIPLAGVTYGFSDGPTGGTWPFLQSTSFGRTFHGGDVGVHTVEVAASTGAHSCSKTLTFTVKPTPWLHLNAAPVAGHPLRVQLTAGGLVDGKQITAINWALGGDTPVDCWGWCNNLSL